MPPQVVVVLELLVADGTDVGHAGRPRHWLHWTRGRRGTRRRERNPLISKRYFYNDNNSNKKETCDVTRLGNEVYRINGWSSADIEVSRGVKG